MAAGIYNEDEKTTSTVHDTSKEEDIKEKECEKEIEIIKLDNIEA
eukprot:CAMPEP_0197834906 /NCGR_PEP_ID=MMETSP1437-20131217/24099_1 /TAXON_ID=49252 ORGANISM="Eucampia antarctica, Strain CCMP1452" /NCGR_SAMPLE_ID=MMETSP1437 /ASSEMBLY_ACC=CAM_ASM_001096 /LENGTH=44 /DNA_ID= /DNA_START= /DNA_END= /DNA_ORIENTATION=